ncbi:MULTISPECIES: hypothetical protein [unclassified Avibacterium]|uniref:hypothetical protein n=1 Tax=unclassified Avibacterium TaxID=2685287 RepID=UPI002E0F09D4|nr:MULTISPECIES: hypothetical protein [unclassified Avibacterium]
MMKETIYNPIVIDTNITPANEIWDNWFNDERVASADFMSDREQLQVQEKEPF